MEQLPTKAYQRLCLPQSREGIVELFDKENMLSPTDIVQKNYSPVTTRNASTIVVL